jgi:hypothetical protein
MPKSTFTVKIHTDGNTTPQQQHVKNGDTVNFTSDQGSWSVSFDKGTPLPQSSYNGAIHASSGGIIDGAVGQTYKYTSSCTVNGQTKSVDPDIIIDAT